MHPDLLSQACKIYNTSPKQLIQLSGGHYNAVYQFPLTKTRKYGILRIGVEDCPPEQTLSMLDWVRYLSMHGAPVAKPILSSSGQLLEQMEFEGQRYNLTAFEKAPGILAEDIPPSEWTDGLFRSIGSTVGRLHRISVGYLPEIPDFNRPHWYDSYEIRDAVRLFANSSDPAQEKLNRVISELRYLPLDSASYGLIHEDLHFANFLILEDGRVTVFDFDDCAYGWFAMDVAMALFDVLVLYNAADEAESQRFARRFLSSYLAGYRSEYDISPFWLGQIPNFLKLKELCIYPTLVGHPDVSLPDTWVGRFMRGRAEHIINDIPYVNIVFTDL